MSAELRAALERLLDDVRFIETTLIRSGPESASRYDEAMAASSRIKDHLIHDVVQAKMVARAALASTSIDGVSGTGLEELRRLSDAATAGEWSLDRQALRDYLAAYPSNRDDFAFIVAAVNWVRATLAKDSPSRA